MGRSTFFFSSPNRYAWPFSSFAHRFHPIIFYHSTYSSILCPLEALLQFTQVPCFSPTTFLCVYPFLIFLSFVSFVRLFFYFFPPFIHPYRPSSQPPLSVFSFLQTFISIVCSFLPSFTGWLSFIKSLILHQSACHFTLPSIIHPFFTFSLHSLPCRHYPFCLDEMRRHEKSSQRKPVWMCWEH